MVRKWLMNVNVCLCVCVVYEWRYLLGRWALKCSNIDLVARIDDRISWLCVCFLLCIHQKLLVCKRQGVKKSGAGALTVWKMDLHYFSWFIRWNVCVICFFLLSGRMLCGLLLAISLVFFFFHLIHTNFPLLRFQ